MRSAIVAVSLAYGLSAASITLSTTVVGPNGSGNTVYRYDFDLSGLPPLEQDQELRILFPAATYQSLSNGVAPSGFDLLVLPPNVPAGADGVYSLLSLMHQVSMLGSFSVDFTLVGDTLPNGIRFDVNEFDANGEFLDTVTSGLTEVPEPRAWVLMAAGTLFVGLLQAAGRRKR